MKAKLQRLQERIDALELRERALLFITLLIGFSMLWQQLLLSPLEREQKQALAQIDSLQKEIVELDSQYRAIIERSSVDPNAENRQLVQRYRERSNQLEQNIVQSVAGLIKPNEMARVVEQVLEGRRGLQLLQAQSLPSQPLLTVSAEDGTVHDEGVYRHGLRLKLEGSYLAALEYLSALEQLPWELKWDSVEVEMQEYPQALITITVHTLSLSEEWIGV